MLFTRVWRTQISVPRELFQLSSDMQRKACFPGHGRVERPVFIPHNLAKKFNNKDELKNNDNFTLTCISNSPVKYSTAS